MPQAASAHDTFWDFVSLMPEITHMLMWVMSDRAIPRSYRMMQGFGVHTFRLLNAEGESNFVKFHWRPIAGTHSLAWDEAVKISGADPDFHRRDLWEAIEAGAYPEWEFGMQIFTEEQAETFSFDVLDATKIVPEELVPVTPVGKMVLNRNPDNFFAETEQVAFCVAHIVPGLDFSNDPLLAAASIPMWTPRFRGSAGRTFTRSRSTLRSRRFTTISATACTGRRSIAAALSMNRIHWAGAARSRRHAAGFTLSRADSRRQSARQAGTVCGSLHSGDAVLEQSDASGGAHIIRAFRFELTKVQTPAVRERVVAMLANVAGELAERVAQGLGMTLLAPMPKFLEKVPAPEVESSPALSLFTRPGDGSIRTRRVAILVADGVDGASAAAIHSGLAEAGAVPRYVGARLGQVQSADGEAIEVEVSMEAMPAVLFDALVVPGGRAAAQTLGKLGHAAEFIKDQYRHCKPILALGAGRDLVENAGVPARLPSGKPDPGLLVFSEDGAEEALPQLVEAIAKHRHHAREMDPPAV